MVPLYRGPDIDLPGSDFYAVYIQQYNLVMYFTPTAIYLDWGILINVQSNRYSNLQDYSQAIYKQFFLMQHFLKQNVLVHL